MKSDVFKLCQRVLPEWQPLSIDEFDFDDPKGFSSFTMGIRCHHSANPPAVLYRRLEGKENAILDFDAEKSVFLTLADHGIAASCYYYDRSCRIESFYPGRTLTAEDLKEPDNLRQIAGQLHRLHQLRPDGLPARSFFTMMFEKWGRLARTVLEGDLSVFPDQEARLCESLKELYDPQTYAMVARCLPEDLLCFCHNDTYHGNIMKLDNGDIKLLDFEFSCLNYRSYDFTNLFAETAMQHQLPEYPYFRLVEPTCGDRELRRLIDYYLDHENFANTGARDIRRDELLQQCRLTSLLSDFKYALAAVPLSVEPIQKIRFIPYAHARFKRFKQAYQREFGEA